MAVPVCQQVAHVHDLTLRHSGILVAELLRDAIGRLPDRLNPVDDSREEHLVLDQLLFGFRSVPLDRFDQLDDVEQEVAVRVHKMMASARTLS